MRLFFIKLLFGGVDSLVTVITHVEQMLRNESAKLHSRANELSVEASTLRGKAVTASTVADKIKL